MRVQLGASIVKSIDATAGVVNKLSKPDVIDPPEYDSSEEINDQEAEKIFEKSLNFRDLQIHRLPAHDQSVFCAVGKMCLGSSRRTKAH